MIDEPIDNVPVPQKRDAWIVGSVSIAAFLFALIGSLVIMLQHHDHLQQWSNFLGIAAGLSAIFQYFPQIYTTFKLGKVLSLSIMTMSMQVPGGFLFAFALWLKVGWGGWATWLVYCITASIQGVLFGMALRFEAADAKARKMARTEEDDITETDPLLANGDKNKKQPSVLYRSSGSGSS